MKKEDFLNPDDIQRRSAIKAKEYTDSLNMPVTPLNDLYLPPLQRAYINGYTAAIIDAVKVYNNISK